MFYSKPKLKQQKIAKTLTYLDSFCLNGMSKFVSIIFVWNNLQGWQLRSAFHWIRIMRRNLTAEMKKRFICRKPPGNLSKPQLSAELVHNSHWHGVLFWLTGSGGGAVVARWWLPSHWHCGLPAQYRAAAISRPGPASTGRTGPTCKETRWGAAPRPSSPSLLTKDILYKVAVLKLADFHW